MLLLSLSAALGPLRVPAALRASRVPSAVAQATRLSWDDLRSELDTLPVFAITNPTGAPLENERDGRKLALCFAEPAAAQPARGVGASRTPRASRLPQSANDLGEFLITNDYIPRRISDQELAKARALYPDLNLAIRPTGLGTSLERVRAGTALFVPGAEDLIAARDAFPDGEDWDNGALPLFGCHQVHLGCTVVGVV